MSNKVLDAALQYANVGLKVLRLNGGGKTPDTPHGVNDATTDIETIEQWFNEKPNANIGIATGEVVGVDKQLVVVDLDVGHADGVNGITTLDKWQEVNGTLPTTLKVRTGSGGLHGYYFVGVDKVYKQRSNILKGFDCAEQTGVDAKVGNGYLVAPPSVNAKTGKEYEWIDGFDMARIADGNTVLDKLLTYHNNNDNKQSTQSKPTATTEGWAAFTVPREEMTNETINALFESIDTLKLSFCEGQRNDSLYRLACSLQGKGLPDNQIRVAIHDRNKGLCKPPLEVKEVNTIIDSALKNPKGEDTTSKKDKKPRLNLATFSEYIEGLTPPTGFAYNETTRDVEIYGRGSNVNEEDVLNHLIDELQDLFHGVTKDKVQACITMYALEHSIDPIMQAIKSKPWDGIDRLIPLAKMLGVEDDTLSQTFVKKWLMQGYCGLFNTKEHAIALDMVLVLQGKQGFGKTRLLEKLALGYFGEGESLNPSDKDSVMAVSSCFIFEMGELGSTMRRDRDILKTFISRPVDRIRLPYGRTLVKLARRTILAGTVNENDFLVDDTGNRRWLVVSLGGDKHIDMDELKRFDAQQLWAQIKHLVDYEVEANGNTYADCFRLTPEEADARDRRNLDFARPLYGEQEVLDILAARQSLRDDDKASVKVVDQWHKVSDFISANEELRKFGAANVAKVLRKLGIKEKYNAHLKTTEWELPWIVGV